MPRFSQDGGRVAYDADNQIWVYDRETGANTLLVDEGDNDYPATWSRDGRWVYFESGFTGSSADSDAFRILADGSEPAEQLFSREGNQFPLSTSLDNTQLLVVERTADRGLDLVIMNQGQDSATFTDYLRADWNEYSGTISPDGERVAYVSDESGIPEVYVRSFPEARGQLPVSDGGGTEPVWAPDGATIYYRSGRRVMRVSVTDAGIGEAVTLFEGDWVGSGGATPMTNWDVHPDGTSFVLVRSGTEVSDAAGAPVIEVAVVTNWFEELRQRMGN